MDPYIERQRWGGFHSRLIIEIATALVPHLRPTYTVEVEEYVYLERQPDEELRRARPDVALFQDRPLPFSAPEGGVATLVEPVAVPLPMPERERHRYLEIRSRKSGALVTAIEVLSPGNKRVGSSARSEYLDKREALLLSTAHLVEMDLLRGGERLPMLHPLPPADYYVILSRVRRRPLAEVRPLALRRPLPSVPIPLTGDDPDIWLDLQAVFDSVYDRAGYDYSLDYGREVSPPLGEDDARWAQELLAVSREPESG
jgi:hypothetical protein